MHSFAPPLWQKEAFLCAPVIVNTQMGFPGAVAGVPLAALDSVGLAPCLPKHPGKEQEA